MNIYDSRATGGTLVRMKALFGTDPNNIAGTLSDPGAVTYGVKKPDGSAEEWMIEFGTPNTLLRRGFTHDSLKPGTEITVDGYQAKDSALRANGRNVTLPDGKVLFAGSPVADAPYKDPGK